MRNAPRRIGRSYIVLLTSMLAALSGCSGSSAARPSVQAGSHSAATSPQSPYADQLNSPVRGLSAQEVDDLLAGRGMGLARAAELSGYPGPRHVLDLAGALALSDAQREQAQAIFERMQSAAQQLGAEIVERERTLGQAFIDRTISESELNDHTAAIAELQGRLRAVHLRAHLELTAHLDAAQIDRYAQLRGYTAGDASAPADPHAQHHGHAAP